MSIVPNPKSSADAAPEWAKEFGQTVCACLNEIEGAVAGFHFRCSGPREQMLDDHLFLFAPAPLQFSGGPDDGAVVCEQMTVDIDGVQHLFTDVEATYYCSARGEELTSRRRLEIGGRLGERSISVYIFDQPFDDADVKTFFEEDSKSFRIERGSQPR